MTTESTVYVVDDDASVRNSLCALLSSKHYDARAFASAEEFVDAFVPGLSGCLVTDLRMSGMSGLDLQRFVNKMCGLLPVIVVTGHADVRTAVEVMEGGAVTLLEKPFVQQELLVAIEQAIERNREDLRRTAKLDAIRGRIATLSPDECDVMELMVEGHPNKVIASRLCISLRTCDRRRRRILDRMGVDTVPPLAAMLATIAYQRQASAAETSSTSDFEGAAGETAVEDRKQ